MAVLTSSRAVRRQMSHTFRIRAGDLVNAGKNTTLDPLKLNVRTHLCTIPANALITMVAVHTPVAFNDPTATLAISIGTATTPTAYINGTNIKVVAASTFAPQAGMAVTTAPLPIYLKCTSGAAAGTAPSTTGDLVIAISYIDIDRTDEVMVLGADTELDAVQQ